jgi:hypothetical protein
VAKRSSFRRPCWRPAEQARRWWLHPRNVWTPLGRLRRQIGSFRLVVVQDGGAIMKADVALRVMRARDRVIPEAAEIDCRPDGVLLRPSRYLRARPLAQPRPAGNGPRDRGWFKPARPETVLPGRFPLFIIERARNDVVYGFRISNSVA